MNKLNFPIWGELEKVSKEHKSDAKNEIFTTFILSTLPIWFGPIIISISLEGYSFFNLLQSNLIRGELYIYSSSLMAAPLYFMWQEIRPPSHFPQGRPILFSFIGVLIISVGLFSFSRFLNFVEVNIENFKIDNDSLIVASIIIYIFTTFVVYAAFAYRNHRLGGAGQEMSQETRIFVEDYEVPSDD